MKEKIETLQVEVQQFEVKDAQALEAYRIKFLGAKGAIKDLYGFLKTVPNEQKREVGQQINELRELAEEKFNSAKEKLEDSAQYPQSHSRQQRYSRQNQSRWAGCGHPHPEPENGS